MVLKYAYDGPGLALQMMMFKEMAFRSCCPIETSLECIPKKYPINRGWIKSCFNCLKVHPEPVSGSHYQWFEIPKRSR